ncbi:kinase-like domain-containing protein [Trichoderma austrokoningii]
MNSISAAEADKHRLLFTSEVESRLDQFCQSLTSLHPEHASCKPFPIGNDGCIKHGSFNLCVFVQFATPAADKWVIRIPFPDRNPWIQERLRSEIATMAYVAAKTTIPVPKIHAYSLESNNVIRSPFIVMDYCKGQSLYELQFQKGGPSPNHTVEKVYQQLASVYLQLRQLEFPRIGALGLPRYSGQPPTESDIDGITVQSRPLSMNMAMQHTEGYQPEDIIQGGMTFSTAREFVTALSRLSKNQFQKSPDVRLDCRPGRSLLYANEAFHTFTDTWLKFENGPFVLWHMDIILQNNNILFDPTTLKIVAALDWECSFVVPVQFLVPPVWLTGSGFGFMLHDLKWYDEEVEKFRRQVKSLELQLQTTTRPLLSDVWTGACDTATIVTLLHPDNIYESY